MPKSRSPDWKSIKEDYLIVKDNMSLKDFANKHNIKYSTLRSRKNREEWDEIATSNATSKKHVAIKNNIKIVNELEKAQLTEKQKLFCLYYVKFFNATQAAIKSGYSKESAHVIGHENLSKPKIKQEINKLKNKMTEEIFIDAMDVLRKYIEIAFADITNYITFGSKEVPVIDEEGNTQKDEYGNTITYSINYIDLNEYDEVDGSLIKEIKKGKAGVSIKLEDKMKALEKLEQYFDLLPDKWKRQLEEEKLRVNKADHKLREDKIEIERKRFEHQKEMDSTKVW